MPLCLQKPCLVIDSPEINTCARPEELSPNATVQCEKQRQPTQDLPISTFLDLGEVETGVCLPILPSGSQCQFDNDCWPGTCKEGKCLL